MVRLQPVVNVRHLQRVIRVPQKCRSFRHILWRRKSQLLEEIQHCDHDVTQCLNIIQVRD